jgi:hypothetical protein
MNEQKFTIVYKTYKNDLEWFRWSLLSLKKFLNKEDILEVLVYTHDIVENDVKNILNELQFESFLPIRIFPIHYNYHGYIKQMVVKVNCYKDVQTPFIIILDSDVIFKQNILFSSLLTKDNKINWYYLDKKDDENAVEFSVWKEAVENSTHQEFNKYYMANSFPFILNKSSMEKADLKFKELNNCDYEYYCYNKCHDSNINVDESTVSQFGKLSKIFEEFEFLGWYNHYHNSLDYNFISFHDALKKNELINYSTTYCKQFWSHGGLNDELLNEIKTILNIY